jgi:hypothetical protein
MTHKESTIPVVSIPMTCRRSENLQVPLRRGCQVQTARDHRKTRGGQGSNPGRFGWSARWLLLVSGHLKILMYIVWCNTYINDQKMKFRYNDYIYMRDLIETRCPHTIWTGWKLAWPRLPGWNPLGARFRCQNRSQHSQKISIHIALW